MTQENSFIIRPLEPDDRTDYFALLTHPKIVNHLRELPSMEMGELDKWMAQESEFLHRLVAEQNGRIIGYAQLTHNHRIRLLHSGVLKLMVHPDYWRLGIGTALLEAVLNIADNWLNLTRLQINIFTNNKAGLSIFKKFGFASEGVRKKVVFGNGRFQDDHVMVRLRNTFIYDHLRSSPPPPRPTGPRPTGKVIYRFANQEDGHGMYQLFHFPEVCRTTLQLPSQELWRSQQRIKQPMANMVRHVAEVDGTVVGMANLFQPNEPRLKHSGALGMMVHPHYWGMGIGTQLMKNLVSSADNWFNLTRVELEVNTDNPAAVALYHKVGFEIEGTHSYHAYGDGRMADSYFMARIQE